MLTLPAEVSNNKNLVTSKPVLLIYFVDRTFRVGSTDYTASGNLYSSLLKRGLSLSAGQSLPQLINGLSSISPPTVVLTSWQGTVRANLMGSDPYLGDVDVNFYLKYDTATTLITNAILYYKGVASIWETFRDIVTIKLKNIFDFPDIGILLSSEDFKTIAGENTIKPIQIGDFNWSTDPRYQTDRANPYAICPLHIATENDITQTWTWYVAGHQMENMPTASNLEDDFRNAYAFIVRDKKFVHVKFGTSTVTVTNTSEEAKIEADLTDHVCHLYELPTVTGIDNTASNPANSYDGKVSTSVTVNFDEVLHVQNPDFQNLSENEKYPTGDSKQIDVRFGSITGNGHVFKYSINGTVWYTEPEAINEDLADDWFPFSPGSVSTTKLEELYNLQIKIEGNGSSGSVEVIEVILRVRVQSLSSNEMLYLRCQGIEYSGTWNSRKTSGNLIENPADVVEMLLRDYLSQGDSDIDMDSFDVVNTAYSSIDACGTIYSQKSAKSLLNEISDMFNWGLVYSQVKLWRLVSPVAADNNFSSSGTGTPGNEDIFIDTPSISSGIYSQHPVKKESFELDRSSEKDLYGELIIEFLYTHRGYLNSVSTGSGKTKTLSNWLLANSTSATNFQSKIANWFLNQKMIAKFDTFYNAIAHEVGDVINIRHSDLNDNILDATVNTQKWMILEIRQNWRPNTIEIEAIELF